MPLRFIGSYILIAVLCFSCNSKTSNADCARFRKGEFIMHSREFGTAWKFIRNDSIQKEINLTDGSVQTFEVKWINDCEHTLRSISITSVDSSASEQDKIIQSHLRSVLSHMRIVNIGKNYYQVIAGKDGYGEFLSDTIWEAGAYHGIGGFKPIGEVFKTK